MFLLIPAVVIGLILSGCAPRDRYERKLKKGLESGERSDSLFMGIYLGMTSKQFYAHCWDLNKKGLIKQGAGNKSVEYQVNTELKHPGLMNFYPTFVNDRIYEMPVSFKYKGWAPWNKELSAENLQKDILRWFEKKYGSGFMKVKHPVHGVVWVKIDGNRRITVFRRDELLVWAYFTDMSVPGPKDMIPENVPNDSIQ